jgi:hypothetical protein
MSARPGRIIEDLRLDFPRPRTTELVTSAEFSASSAIASTCCATTTPDRCRASTRSACRPKTPCRDLPYDLIFCCDR